MSFQKLKITILIFFSSNLLFMQNSLSLLPLAVKVLQISYGSNWYMVNVAH